MDAETLAIRVITGLDQIDPEIWDACAAPEQAQGGRPANPFLTHRFLSALERSGSATPETGWAPHHLVAESPAGAVIGVMPLYIKNHSQGEYVFDYGWADAFMRAGGDYYPKLQCAAPFTPVTGRRLLSRPNVGVSVKTIQLALVQGAAQCAAQIGLSSIHWTFCEKEEWDALGAVGLLQRQDQQFHWFNREYRSFEDFLDGLASRKRKQIRRERRQALESGITVHRLTGDAIQPEHWDAFWTFYQDTAARKWGSPYLTRAFFDIAQQSMRHDILLVLCERNNTWIAGALNFIGRDTLFGRYWGCVEHHEYLHFEVCYYQAIEIAIEMGILRVEAGAQGAHKVARGYEPVATYSAHWIAHPGLRDAVARYLVDERAAVRDEIKSLTARMPFKKA